MDAACRPPEPAGVVNAMTVDVEDYFQVSAFDSHVDKAHWPSLPCRVEANTERILELFESYRVRGTFFTLGWVAERYPGLIRKIVDNGHELASHGWEHIRVSAQTPQEFRADVTRTRKLLEDISGTPVKGYRAASYSIGFTETWAWEELAAAGYRYSSSIVPIRHDHYGMPGAPRFAFQVLEGKLLEVPITTVSLAGRNFNCGGGGWFRLFPYRFSRWALNKVNGEEGQAGVFYFHPWEIDHEQPRLEGLGAKTRFRHYLNLHHTYGRVERLLEDFRWGRMDDIFLPGETF
jgi:polysaccharide deacetylase family protein (PEP-CTERM system associated)